MTNPEITDYGTERDHDDDNDGVLDDLDHFPLMTQSHRIMMGMV